GVATVGEERGGVERDAVGGLGVPAPGAAAVGGVLRGPAVVREAQGDARAGVPAAQVGDAGGVVGEEEVLDGVPAAAVAGRTPHGGEGVGAFGVRLLVRP